MTYKTRKHIWPLAALMSLAVFGVLAAVVALSVGSAPVAQAHPCDTGTIQERAQCDTEHENDGLDSTDSNHEHPTVTNNAPTVSMALEDLSLRVEQSSGIIDISGVFEDADGDTLTYSKSTNNASVADATIVGSQMTVLAGNTRGTAEITVTADDGNGGTASDMFMVTVAEAYDLTAAEPNADPDGLNLPDPVAPDVYARLRGIPLDAIYLAEGAFDAHFTLAVAGSMDDVTVTVTASEIIDITIDDSDGLIGAGFVDEEETDLEGSLTVKSTDQGSRAFEIEGMCEAAGGWALIEVEDKDLELVAEGAIYCPLAAEPPPPPDDEFRSDMMTVVSYNDWDHWEMYETVSDGFLIDDSDNNVDHMVNQSHNKMGILVRDEPVVRSYQLAIDEMERLDLLPGGLPRRTKMQAEEGQRTVEVLVGRPYVQLTVTSVMEGPAYIRFLDSDMQPFGDSDMDEDPRWRGADVVGLDSQGRLALNMMPELSKAKALAYDQYRVIIPGPPTDNAYLSGLAGSYYQGAFRFFNPCPSELGEGHHFYVEVYESTGKYLKTTEKVMCVPSPRPGPAGLVFEIDSQKPGEGVLSFEPALNAVGHTVLLIDASNRNIVESVTAVDSMFNADTGRYSVTFDNLNNGWTYHIVVIAEGAANQYTADAVRDYGVSWLGQADVPLSTDPSATPTRQHALCMVDNAAITALLSDCDTAPPPPEELTAPTNVMATVGGTDPGEQTVTVTWTEGMGADRHVVFLFDSDPKLFGVASAQTDGTTTFMNVPSGTYTAVVVAVENGPTGNAADIEMSIFVTVTVN